MLCTGLRVLKMVCIFMIFLKGLSFSGPSPAPSSVRFLHRTGSTIHELHLCFSQPSTECGCASRWRGHDFRRFSSLTVLFRHLQFCMPHVASRCMQRSILRSLWVSSLCAYRFACFSLLLRMFCRSHGGSEGDQDEITYSKRAPLIANDWGLRSRSCER